ncbi:hypothetical protein [Dorea longicatena]|uniref:hypothetical protein n=1 Tax=Dorea longicatena TaxID=88431 RepID=UPI003B50ECB9
MVSLKNSPSKGGDYIGIRDMGLFECKRLNFRHGYKNPRPHFCNRSTLIIHI